MQERVQIIVSPAGERVSVIPEHDYLMLLAASEDRQGEHTPQALKSPLFCLPFLRRKATEADPAPGTARVSRA